jgi:hypothetical protein
MTLVLNADPYFQAKEGREAQRISLSSLMALFSALKLRKSVISQESSPLSKGSSDETMDAEVDRMKREQQPGRTPEGFIPDEQLPSSLFEAMDNDPTKPAARWRAGRRPGSVSSETDAITPDDLERGIPIEPAAQEVLDEFLKNL